GGQTTRGRRRASRPYRSAPSDRTEILRAPRNGRKRPERRNGDGIARSRTNLFLRGRHDVIYGATTFEAPPSSGGDRGAARGGGGGGRSGARCLGAGRRRGAAL